MHGASAVNRNKLNSTDLSSKIGFSWAVIPSITYRLFMLLSEFRLYGVIVWSILAPSIYFMRLSPNNFRS